MSRRVQSLVPCTDCGEHVPTRTARERITSWPEPYGGKGTMTDPQLLEHHNEWLCPSCFSRRKYGMQPKSNDVRQEGLL